jgi:hypothetical protein
VLCACSACIALQWAERASAGNYDRHGDGNKLRASFLPNNMRAELLSKLRLRKFESAFVWVLCFDRCLTAKRRWRHIYSRL